MNDFLDKIWLDNTLRDYAWVLGVILFVIILKKFISRYLAGLMFRGVQRIWKEVDKQSFTTLLTQPLGFFLLILTTIIAVYRLKFPAVLNVEVYEYNLLQILHCISTIVLIVSFTWLMLRIIDFITGILEKKADLTPGQGDNQLIVFFRDFFKVVIAIVGIMMILNYAFGLNVGSLITGLSIVGAAIALALRESLENLIASFIIFFDKPFTTGDLVKVHNITGIVEKIGLRSTRIRSDQKTFVSVPNKQMVDSVLDNLSLRTHRRGDLKLELSLQTPADTVEAVVNGVKKILERPDIEESNVHLSEITSTSFVVLSDYYTTPVTISAFNEIKQGVNLQSLQLLASLKVELAGASFDIILKGNAKI
ncbi:MAG: mechanosensitive ion channel [Chitinophagaceae bacterium]|nr:mechanosensitive ion channel [Chitinophagaceae bacterium]